MHKTINLITYFFILIFCSGQAIAASQRVALPMLALDAYTTQPSEAPVSVDTDSIPAVNQTNPNECPCEFKKFANLANGYYASSDTVLITYENGIPLEEDIIQLMSNSRDTLPKDGGLNVWIISKDSTKTSAGKSTLVTCAVDLIYDPLALRNIESDAQLQACIRDFKKAESSFSLDPYKKIDSASPVVSVADSSAKANNVRCPCDFNVTEAKALFTGIQNGYVSCVLNSTVLYTGSKPVTSPLSTKGLMSENEDLPPGSSRAESITKTKMAVWLVSQDFTKDSILICSKDLDEGKQTVINHEQYVACMHDLDTVVAALGLTCPKGN